MPSFTIILMYFFKYVCICLCRVLYVCIIHVFPGFLIFFFTILTTPLILSHHSHVYHTTTKTSQSLSYLAFSLIQCHEQ